MKLIDETKVKNEISKIEKVVNGKLSTAFEKGVEFAETELQNIAIEFANWIGDNQFSFSENQNKWVKRSYSYGNITGSEIISDTTQQLFEIFLSKRTK